MSKHNGEFNRISKKQRKDIKKTVNDGFFVFFTIAALPLAKTDGGLGRTRTHDQSVMSAPL